MTGIVCLGTQENYGWICVGYDIQYRYGYETMLSLLDRFVSEYAVRVDRIDKAMLAGMAPVIVWKKWLFNKPQPLSQMEALKEEYGNGRVGRLVMFKECLANGIVPFIITDDLNFFYCRGLNEWGHINGCLTDTCLTAQDNYKALLDYFKIKH